MTRTTLLGIARPTPSLPPECERIRVLMPTTWPVASTRGPPLLPGFTGASVWTYTAASSGLSCRATALTTPMVTVFRRPSGEPKASTTWPCFSRVGVAQRQGLEVLARDLQQREVRDAIDAHDLRVELDALGPDRDQPGRGLRAFRQLHLDAARAGDDVGVRHDVAVGVDDDTGGRPFLPRQQGRLSVAAHADAAGEDLHDRGRDALGDLLERPAEGLQRLAGPRCSLLSGRGCRDGQGGKGGQRATDRSQFHTTLLDYLRGNDTPDSALGEMPRPSSALTRALQRGSSSPRSSPKRSAMRYSVRRSMPRTSAARLRLPLTSASTWRR